MKVAVIGATGKAGRLIAREARQRGHEITAVTRPASVSKLEDNYAVLPKDLFQLTTDDLRGFDIVVNAFATDFTKPGNEELNLTAVEHLIEIMEPIPEVRLISIGGAGSLYKDETRTTRVLDTMSPEFRAVPYYAYLAWLKLKDSKVSYTFVSPAETFDFAGPRTGKYTLGTDVAIKNSVGLSYITYADFAVAMVDEFENRRFLNTRYTAVSEAKYKTDGKSFFRLGINPFTRMGSYFGLFAGSTDYGAASLYIGTRRGDARLRPTPKLIDITPIYKGRKIPFALMTTPEELIVRTQYGNLRCCMADPSLIYIKGENGLGLRMDKEMEAHEIMKPRKNGAWEGCFRRVGSYVFNPLKGKIDMDAKWDWERLCTPIVRADVLPDENGEFLLSVEEFTHAGMLRDSYPSYEEGLANVKADWEAFASHMPDIGERYKEERLESAYMTWSHIVGPSGLIKRPFIYMMGTSCASSWQMCESAVVLKNNLPLAIELLLNMIDQQAPTGQLPDLYDNMTGSFMMYKPPIQGWALNILMKQHDFATEVPRDKLEMLYTGFGKWADWFYKYRDIDGDGIPQYEHGDESGNDDSSIFRNCHRVKLPDMLAFLSTLDDALSKIARILGREDEEKAYTERSERALKILIEKFWNGERFIGFDAETGEIIATKSIMFFRPLVLGARLPKEITDKMAQTLSEEGRYLSPYGLLNTQINSADYSRTGFGNGGVPATENILTLTGLYDAGYKDLAREIAKRFCEGMKLGGSAYFGVSTGFTGSWGASAFQILADLAVNG